MQLERLALSMHFFALVRCFHQILRVVLLNQATVVNIKEFSDCKVCSRWFDIFFCLLYCRAINASFKAKDCWCLEILLKYSHHSIETYSKTSKTFKNLSCTLPAMLCSIKVNWDDVAWSSWNYSSSIDLHVHFSSWWQSWCAQRYWSFFLRRIVWFWKNGRYWKHAT